MNEKRRGLSAPLPFHYLTIHHRRHRTHRRSHDCRPYDRRRVHAPILRPISDHIHRDQLQRRYIQYQKRTHFITGNALPCAFYKCWCMRILRFLPSVCTYPGVPRSSSSFANSSIALSPPCVKLMTRIF